MNFHKVYTYIEPSPRSSKSTPPAPKALPMSPSHQRSFLPGGNHYTDFGYR